MKHITLSILGILLASGMAGRAWAGIIVFEAVGANPAGITATRDAFRAAVGGGTVAGANGSFGGIRTEINWDGVPDSSADPNLLPGDFFNTLSPRGVVLSTPGTGFLVSANSGGATPVLFGLPAEFQTFSSQRLFTAVNSNITDVNFFLPGTTSAAATSAFGIVFVDVEAANTTKIEFFDASNNLIFSRFALAGGNQGLTFLGGVADAGEQIARVRITSGLRGISSNGVLSPIVGDTVVMDDFLFGAPTAFDATTPEPGTLALFGMGALALGWKRTAARKRA